MESPLTLLLTGATGYIGKHLLASLLTAGHRVIALVRPRKSCPKLRLAAALSPFDQRGLNRVEVIEADITTDSCGLSASDLRKLSELSIDAVIHSAGMTRFEEHLAEEIFQHNLHGTRRVFELSLKLRIPRFHHLSTVYVAGDYEGIFKTSDLNVDQGFRNPYERSKYEAEQYLQQVADDASTHIHIHRPSIVTGGYMLGENNSANTVYTFLKSMHHIQQHCLNHLTSDHGGLSTLGVRKVGDELVIPLRIEACKNATLNMVSISQVTSTLQAAIEQPSDGFSVSHIVGGRDFKLDELRRPFCEAIGISSPDYVSTDDFRRQSRNLLEQRLFRSTKAYLPYLHASPLFERGDDDNNIEIDPAELAREFLAHINQSNSPKTI